MDHLFDLTGKVAVITGGGGLLGKEHAHAIASAGGTPVLWDINDVVKSIATDLVKTYGVTAAGMVVDITDANAVQSAFKETCRQCGQVDILINNAARNPKVETAGATAWSRPEQFSLDQWELDIAVGLTGSFLCTRVLGADMALRGSGVIVNIASDLSVIAPDQRLYELDGVPADEQPVKPVTYPVVKSGLLGLTRYFASYYAGKGVRVNALSPGGVANTAAPPPSAFLEKITKLIPLGRMANEDEYHGVIQFLCSDASSYITGQNIIVDGGRTII